MSINANHPTVLDFKTNEVQTLQFLRTRNLLKEFRELDDSITYGIANYKNPDRVRKMPFEFHAKFPLVIQNHEHTVIIEARITQNIDVYEEATYSLSVTDKKAPKELIRKFHFDHADPSIVTNQPVPIFHLQYGGKLSPKMESLGITGEKLDHWLSVPRFIFPPINLALILDMAFSEFRTEQTIKLIEKSEWRQLIYKNEEFIQKSFYCNIANFCTSASYNNKRLIRDFVYGKF